MIIRKLWELGSDQSSSNESDLAIRDHHYFITQSCERTWLDAFAIKCIKHSNTTIGAVVPDRHGSRALGSDVWSQIRLRPQPQPHGI